MRARMRECVCLCVCVSALVWTHVSETEKKILGRQRCTECTSIRGGFVGPT